jgi:hypothetical protein
MTPPPSDTTADDPTATPTDEQDRLERDGARIERLLDELRSMSGPPAWQRIEELVAALVGLYGAGLERLLTAAGGAGADRAGLAREARADPLLSSLLLLHDLHPDDTAARVHAVLDRACARLDARIELAAIEPGGVVRLQVTGAGPGWPAAQAALERALIDAAPEIARIDLSVDDLAPGRGARADRSEPDLVQIDLGRSRRGT